MKYSCGVDITKISRFINFSDLHIRRILTTNEYNEYSKRENGYFRLQYLASRWCAKEAIFKSLSSSTIPMWHIEILNDNSGKPFCTNINNVDISISYNLDDVIVFSIHEKL